MGMKIKELIEMAQKCDPEKEVGFCIQDGCCGDNIFLTVIEAEVDDFNSYIKHRDDYKPDNHLRIEFGYLPGYRTCIQSGATVRAHEAYVKKFDIKDDPWTKKEKTDEPK